MNSLHMIKYVREEQIHKILLLKRKKYSARKLNFQIFYFSQKKFRETGNVFLWYFSVRKYFITYKVICSSFKDGGGEELHYEIKWY